MALIPKPISPESFNSKPIDARLIDGLLQGCQDQEALLGPDGLIQQLTKALVERVLQGEMTHHLGYNKHASEGKNTGNSRNGTFPKTIRGKRVQYSSRLTCHVTVTANSGRSLSRKARPALMGLTRRSSHCMLVG